MSENLPYHDEQWDDLPLPNEEEAWQKMQLLLEKEKKRRRLLPVWFWRFRLLAILVVGLATGGYFLLNRQTHISTGMAAKESAHPQETTKQTTVRREPQKNKDSMRVSRPVANKTPDEKKGHTLVIKKDKPGSVKQKWLKKQVKKEQAFLTRKASRQKTSASHFAVPDQKAAAPEKKPGIIPFDSVSNGKAKEIVSERTTQSVLTPPAVSLTTRDSVTVEITPPADSNKVPKQLPKKKDPVVFSAGIGLQQAIAFGGQQTSAYTLTGKQNKFYDHLPSVYLQVKKGHWFLQGELHYNVPQPVKPFAFSQLTAYDVASNLLRTDRLSVQKLYYHQFPISVNYFVLPQWSWGAGVVYSRFAGAVTCQETLNRNVITGSEMLTTQVVPVKGYKDSFLYKSTTGLLLQTDYYWKRFSLGLRYSHHLQPFIKYTRPDGTVLHEKNQVLQAVLRFRLI